MSRVPWWAWAAGAALIVYLFYQHSKAGVNTGSLASLQASSAPLDTGFWPTGDTVSIEDLQQLQSRVYSQENTPQYLNARLSQLQLSADIVSLVDALPQLWPVAVTATAPVTSNGNSAPQS